MRFNIYLIIIEYTKEKKINKESIIKFKMSYPHLV